MMVWGRANLPGVNRSAGKPARAGRAEVEPVENPFERTATMLQCPAVSAEPQVVGPAPFRMGRAQKCKLGVTVMPASLRQS
jgi:hypothetical protein